MRKNEEHRKSMKERVMAKVNQPRQSKFDYLQLPEGFEKFAIDGKCKEIGGKKIVAMRIDIMPYKTGKGNPNCDEGEPYYERTFFVHNVDLGDGNRLKFVCPKKSAGKPCPACEMEAKLRRDPNATKEEVANWAVKERQLFNVRDLHEPDKVKIWDIAYPLFGRLLEASIAGEDDDECLESFAELKGGKTLRIQCEEKKFGAGKYYEVQKIDFKDRDEDYESSAIDESACLDDMLIIKSYDELNRMLFEDKSEESDGEFSDEESAESDADRKAAHGVAASLSHKKKTVSREKYKDDDDDDDDDEAKSVKSKTVSKPRMRDEDEDEDDEEDEPVKKTKKTASSEDDSEKEDKKSVAKASRDSAGKAKIAKTDDGEEDADDEDEVEDEVGGAKKPVRKESRETDKSGKKKCPYGHKFGIDCDADHCADDCIECELWDACSDAQEEMA